MEVESALEFAADHPAFEGHFPGAPIVPGVLLLDAALHALEQSGHVVTEVASAKFLRPVGPGESLSLACQLERTGRARFVMSRGPENVASGQLVLGANA
ncbi:MAG: 3-hydroxyacyl-ACP dehydratase [Comamonadaceae bacterium]|nr:MAG: 3-hydroxyacyl-ACP dehydratase [Comamonadaceae bacterium]